MKLGQGNMWWIIVIAVLAVIAGAIMIFGFKSLFGKETKVISGKLDALGDCDGDGVINQFDRCPTTKFTIESDALSGCPDTAAKPIPKSPKFKCIG